MAVNTNPIFSAKGDVQGLAGILTTAAVDYTGQNINNYPVFRADATNGGSATQDNTTGILFSAGDFTAGSKTVTSGDTLSVSYTATAA